MQISRLAKIKFFIRLGFEFFQNDFKTCLFEKNVRIIHNKWAHAGYTYPAGMDSLIIHSPKSLDTE